MKHLSLVAAFFAITFSLTACSDDDSFIQRPSDGDNPSKSSSSVAPKSSSSVKGVSYGSMTDSRDGQTYRTVTLFGAQTWMAENLNYAYTDVPFYYFDNFGSDSSSWCHSNDIAKCEKYGRLYTWSAAMDSVGTWSANGKGCGFYTKCTPIYPVRGICPEGWHLPDSTEWATLLTTVGGQSIAGKKLKSLTGWFNSGNGTDNFDFSALPASIRGGIGGYGLDGNYTYFWSSTEDDDTHANSLGLRLDKDDADLGVYSKHDGLSVRCLKD